jgi:hypothetical protein
MYISRITNAIARNVFVLTIELKQRNAARLLDHFIVEHDCLASILPSLLQPGASLRQMLSACGVNHYGQLSGLTECIRESLQSVEVLASQTLS